jgi:hypothetical protein
MSLKRSINKWHKILNISYTIDEMHNNINVIYSYIEQNDKAYITFFLYDDIENTISSSSFVVIS